MSVSVSSLCLKPITMTSISIKTNNKQPRKTRTLKIFSKEIFRSTFPVDTSSIKLLCCTWISPGPILIESSEASKMLKKFYISDCVTDITLLENLKLCPKIQFSEKFKILNLNFLGKRERFLRIFKCQFYLDNLNFRAKNGDFM